MVTPAHRFLIDWQANPMPFDIALIAVLYSDLNGWDWMPRVKRDVSFARVFAHLIDSV
jgi:hypothetical protein